MTRINRWLGSLGLAAGLGVACAVAMGQAHAQTSAPAYPTRPIRVVVPFAPGGVVDVTARLLAQKMTERLGWQVVVENRPGGNGFIAVTQVAKAAPDGYTLLMAHTGEFAVNPALFPNIPYDLKRDFTAITMVNDTPMLLVANSQAPFNTFPEMLAAARKAPGTIAYSSPGNGSINHLAGEWIALEGGVKLLHIPYKGGSPAVAAVAAGEVPLGVVAVPAILPHLKSGRIKVIGLTTAKRSPIYPEWVTAQEAGVKGVDASNWVGLFAPKDVPAAIIQTLHKEVAATLALDEVRKRFAENGAEIGVMSSADFIARIDSDAARVREVVQRAQIKPE
jgi:tripartite-type tricarboxylate transporter receptor subunit TctC